MDANQDSGMFNNEDSLLPRLNEKQIKGSVNQFGTGFAGRGQELCMFAQRTGEGSPNFEYANKIIVLCDSAV